MSASASANESRRRQDVPDDVVGSEYEGHPLRDEEGPRDRFSPLLILAVAVAAIVEAFRLGVGDFAEPGPGLWPLLVAGTAAVLAPIIFVVGHRFTVPERQGLFRVGVIVLGLWVFVITYQWIGFIAAGFVMLMLVTRMAARERWLSSVLISALAPAAAYLVFATLLGVNLRLY